MQTPYKEPSINIALDTIAKNKQALIFVSSKRSAEKTAEDISKKIKKNKLIELSNQILKTLSKPTKQCIRLAKCIEKGIAFHHSGLHYKQKELIENAFKNNIIKIIACTPTLAAGLDMPAFRTILKSVKRYSQTGYNFIPVLEYHQMAGRAGRPGMEDYGEAIMIASTQPQSNELLNRYIKGVPEDIFSKLAVEPVLRTYILSLIAAGFVKTKQDIIHFFSKTFWAYQFKDLDKLTYIIEKMLHLLTDYKFLTHSSTNKTSSNKTSSNETSPNEISTNEISSNKISNSITTIQSPFTSADNITQQTYQTTAIGKRVAELYLDPLTANHLLTCLNKNQNPTDLALLQAVSHTLEMRPLLRVRIKEFENYQQEVLKHTEQLLEPEPTIYDYEYDEYLDSLKTAFFFNDWINENLEDFLLEKYNITPGAIHAKLNIIDWLLYANAELVNISGLKPAIKYINKLRFRLKHGIKEELIPLCRLKNISKIRARKLYNHNIKNLGDIKKSNIQTLIQLLGEKIAINIKEQVGQTAPKEIKPTKRLGQMSLGKY